MQVAGRRPSSPLGSRASLACPPCALLHLCTPCTSQSLVLVLTLQPAEGPELAACAVSKLEASLRELEVGIVVGVQLLGSRYEMGCHDIVRHSSASDVSFCDAVAFSRCLILSAGRLTRGVHQGARAAAAPAPPAERAFGSTVPGGPGRLSGRSSCQQGSFGGTVVCGGHRGNRGDRGGGPAAATAGHGCSARPEQVRLLVRGV